MDCNEAGRVGGQMEGGEGETDGPGTNEGDFRRFWGF